MFSILRGFSRDALPKYLLNYGIDQSLGSAPSNVFAMLLSVLFQVFADTGINKKYCILRLKRRNVRGVVLSYLIFFSFFRTKQDFRLALSNVYVSTHSDLQTFVR